MLADFHESWPYREPTYLLVVGPGVFDRRDFTKFGISCSSASNPLGRCALSTGKNLPTFRGMLVLSCSGLGCQRRDFSDYLILKMEAFGFCETFVIFCHSTRRNVLCRFSLVRLYLFPCSQRTCRQGICVFFGLFNDAVSIKVIEFRNLFL